ncbi:MAG: (4Fe-4S)-binding protein [Polaribacter sp.]|nr:(4Fe-4S)-binding protein [Polaribacter sp.]
MKTYPKEDIKIGWQPEKCTHSANCVKGLSAVFKPKEQPWINPENASKQAIIDQVAKCPSGALTIVQ